MERQTDRVNKDYVEILDDLSAVRTRDPQGILEILGKVDRQIEESLQIGSEASVAAQGQFANVLMAGLGGSAIGGDFVKAFLGNRLKIPFYIHRNYSLPAFVGRSTLVLVSSYSGNTEETLSAFHEARAAGAPIIVFSSNGQLYKLAREFHIPTVQIPSGFPPRTALGYSAIPILKVLAQLGIATDLTEEIRAALPFIRQQTSLLCCAEPFSRNRAKQLAARIHQKLPVVYGSQDRLEMVALRWRGQFSENGKALAYSNGIPEMNHNEIVGWKHPADLLTQVVPIFLRDVEDHPRIQKRIEFTRALLQRQSGTSIECWAEGKSWFERLWSLILLGDFASVYLAFLNGEDPTPVEVIESLKNELKKGDQ
ncbi:MAG: bifunctional phosphoglucose/phosphomannose isomerase [Acidobacteria bacterium]|nr:bifunctional phosphoglucose/phosphomannose isomerase [Acidobacteriota bacterium]